MRVLYERVAGIDVHKEMIKVGIRVPGHRAWTPTSEVLEYRTFYGVLQAMAAGLRKRGVTHVVMEASGVYTEPVYYALMERDFERVAVISPAHAKALKGHKTDAKDALRLAELFECGLPRGSYIPSQDLKRRKIVTLTPAGREQLLALDAIVDRIQEDFLAPLTRVQRRQFTDLLGRLLAAE
jgi:transposase